MIQGTIVINALIPSQTRDESTGEVSASLKLALGRAPSTLHLNDERINMRCLPPERPAFVYARSRRSEIYTLFIIYTSRAFPRVYSLKWMCAPRTKISPRYDTKH